MYNCEKQVIIPPKNFIKCNCSNNFKDSVEVDMCLAGEIIWLWDKEIKTTGCCCGHGRELGYIQVTDDCIEKMRELGYQNYIYPEKFGGSERKDAFIPKSTHHFIEGYTDEYLG